ncbi:biopolymer transporter ExbD [Breoghania sp. L-A4]|uniref:ExbD/TolR family protein n=1 Tax=Breoghania sp. L-A4 TaxID=2304600 RepID=UPI000E359EB4|nr:biopolymer transporter ExbD [Breoghania sp. L-A4]AXS42731.1 biopolymer transporter ExbD [Breoghania sp. L-A4]
MRLKKRARRTPPDNTIPLINIVFLMLIFFLFAGSVARDDARRIAPPDNVAEDESVRSTGALVIDADGRFYLRDEEVDLETFLAAQTGGGAMDGGEDAGSGARIKIAADGALAADKLEEVLKRIAETAPREVVLITRRQSK